jgi:uncharacterized protein (TIGR02646 family)
MIKLEKDLNIVPVSLIPAFSDLFIANNIPTITKTTHGRRMDVINAGIYTDDSNHNSRYKTKDVKDALNDIYHGKCAFCEQKIEQSQVEHYRPKSIYHWLVYSWDNLILACAKCNQGKGINFDTKNARVTFNNNEHNVRSINTSSTTYDLNELPLMVNPEVTDPLGHITFQKNGLIKSDNERFAYTIDKCSIDRSYLNVERKKLLDDFHRDIQSILVENADNIPQQLAEIGVIVKKFIRDAKDVKHPYLAFRKYAIESEWLNDAIKEQN